MQKSQDRWSGEAEKKEMQTPYNIKKNKDKEKEDFIGAQIMFVKIVSVGECVYVHFVLD